MNITLITVGKIKEKFLRDAMEEYLIKLKKYCKINIVEVSDEKTPDNASKKEEYQITTKEGNAILKHIKDNMYVIALAIQGKMLDSLEFLSIIQDLKAKDNNDIVFIIGGSLGLSKEVLNRANYKISFSKMTFPHQLMRVILIEQLSRVLN